MWNKDINHDTLTGCLMEGLIRKWWQYYISPLCFSDQMELQMKISVKATTDRFIQSSDNSTQIYLYDEWSGDLQVCKGMRWLQRSETALVRMTLLRHGCWKSWECVLRCPHPHSTTSQHTHPTLIYFFFSFPQARQCSQGSASRGKHRLIWSKPCVFRYVCPLERMLCHRSCKTGLR